MSKFTTQDQQQALSLRILLARHDAKLTQKQVATVLELSIDEVVKLESGRRTVSTLELSRLAQLFRRPISFFINEPSGIKQDSELEDVESPLRPRLEVLLLAGRDGLNEEERSELLGLALESYRNEEITTGKLRDIGTVLGGPVGTILDLIENPE